MLFFATAVFLLLVVPGPGVLSTAGIGAVFGFKPGLRYIIGLFWGTNLVGLIVISGLAALIFSLPYIRLVLLLLSSVYILYLAKTILFSQSTISFLRPMTPPGVIQGVIFQILNPKAYVVNIAFYSSFAFYPNSLFIEILLKVLISNLIWIPIHFLWLYAGIFLNKVTLSNKNRQNVRLFMACSLIFVVLLSLVSI